MHEDISAEYLLLTAGGAISKRRVIHYILALRHATKVFVTGVPLVHSERPRRISFMKKL